MLQANYSKPLLIAEVGCNHKGDISIAKEMIKIAAQECKVDAVKFQKRCNRELLTEEQYNAPHPHPENSYGATYGEHREFLELSLEQHAELKEVCESNGIIYSTSVWDLTSAKEITTLKPSFIKIPSACNNHYTMLDWLCDNYRGEIHISLGMTNHSEEDELIRFFESKKRNQDLVVYTTTSGYPVPYSDICLLEILRLKSNYAKRVKHIAYSGHHLGIAVDIAAYTLGAYYIERHYSLNRSWKGTDHAASLEPDDLKQLKIDLNAVYESLSYKSQEILPIEQIQRQKLKYRKG